MSDAESGDRGGGVVVGSNCKAGGNIVIDAAGDKSVLVLQVEQGILQLKIVLFLLLNTGQRGGGGGRILEQSNISIQHNRRDLHNHCHLIVAAISIRLPSPPSLPLSSP